MADFKRQAAAVMELPNKTERTLKIGLKRKLRSKKTFSSNERVLKMQKKRATTDFNAPNGSRNITFQSQEFEQYGRRHFVDF